MFRAAIIERDVLKERTAQLERDNSQLKFENETLHYRLRERSSSVSIIPIKLTPPLSLRKKQIRHRARSLPSIKIIPDDNESLTRSFS